MSRIIGGSGRGRRLESPRGLDTRPTASRVRQTLFDILAERVPGCVFLDLFAGGGGVGLEALSRGAARVVFVEQGRDAVVVLKRNLGRLGTARAEVHRQDALVALQALARDVRRFDIIYVDPPYGADLYQPVLERVGQAGLLGSGGLLVAEHFHKRALPETIGGLARVRSSRIGEQRLSFYRAVGEAGAADPWTREGD